MGYHNLQFSYFYSMFHVLSLNLLLLMDILTSHLNVHAALVPDQYHSKNIATFDYFYSLFQ